MRPVGAGIEKEADIIGIPFNEYNEENEFHRLKYTSGSKSAQKKQNFLSPWRSSAYT